MLEDCCRLTFTVTLKMIHCGVKTLQVSYLVGIKLLVGKYSLLITHLTSNHLFA